MLMNVNKTDTGYTLTNESTAELKKILFSEAKFNGLEFNTERNSIGDLVAKPIGLSENNYLLNGGEVVELQGITYHTIHLFYGDHNAVNALLAHDPASDEVKVKWSDELNDSNNRWNNAFMSNYNMLIPLDEDHLLFLESDVTKKLGNIICPHIMFLQERLNDFGKTSGRFLMIMITFINFNGKLMSKNCLCRVISAMYGSLI